LKAKGTAQKQNRSIGRISKATTYKKLNAGKIMKEQKCRPLGGRPVPPHHLAPATRRPWASMNSVKTRWIALWQW